MYTDEDLAAMSATEVQEGLELLFGDFDTAVLQKAAVLIKSGQLPWAEVEEVIGLEPGAGLDVLVAKYG